MFHGEEKSEDGHGDLRDSVGVTADQAEGIAVNNIFWIIGGTAGVFFLIYKFLVK